MYYTLNGGNEMIYTSPITIEKNTEIKAYEVKEDCLRSDELNLLYRTDKLTSGVDGGITWTFADDTLTKSPAREQFSITPTECRAGMELKADIHFPEALVSIGGGRLRVAAADFWKLLFSTVSAL